MSDVIKRYDPILKKWVTSAASNAASLELTNPGFVNESGESISVNHGFTKIDNRITRAEQNIIWLANNKGSGSGGGGGGGSSNYSIEVDEGDTVYVIGTSVTLNILIKSDGVKKQFTVVAKDVTNNKTLGTFKRFSMTKVQIPLTGITSTIDLELTAYDTANVYADPVYIRIITGAISTEINKVPNKTMYINSSTSVPMVFIVNNSIRNSPATFRLLINNQEVASEVITLSQQSVQYDARQLIFESGLFTPQVGDKYYFRAFSEVDFQGDLLTSSAVQFDISIADSNKLSIVTNNISERIPTDQESFDSLTSVTLGSPLIYSYYLSFALSKYQTFNVEYDVVKVTNSGSEILLSGIDENVQKQTNKTFYISTLELEESTDFYYRIDMRGHAVNDPSDTDAQDSKSVYFRTLESETKELYANNYDKQLLAYFSPLTGFPNTTTGTWNYPIRTSGEFEYKGLLAPEFPNGVNLSVHRVNGVTSGFIPNTDSVNDIPGIVLTGHSYGVLEVANQMFPPYDIDGNHGFFGPFGFNISTTFKCDETSDPTEVILSVGTYRDNELFTGFEINTEAVIMRISSTTSLYAKLPQNEQLTIDLDVNPVNDSDNSWEFRIYINGVMTKLTRVAQKDIDWNFAKDLYLGCRDNNGILENFSSCVIYDLKLYTRSQNSAYIVQNYMSSKLQASLVKGVIDRNEETYLKTKNFFDDQNQCYIWDYDNSKYFDGNMLIQKMTYQIEQDNSYPIVIIRETANGKTDFEAITKATFSGGDRDTVMSKQFECTIQYIDKSGECLIRTPSGVSSDSGVKVGIQGTSSLSYSSKNLEIYMGSADEAGKKLLFQPTDEWLPENRFTLKADVMDSAHVNNVVIGKIINGSKNNNGDKPPILFRPTPPMSLSASVWDGDEERRDYMLERIRHTSDGFPCLVFIQFSNAQGEETRQPIFQGIYNFNLGRYAEFNLGMKILKDFTKDRQDGPTLVYEYEEINDHWNKGVANLGMHSFELATDNSDEGAFKQHDMSIIEYMGDVRFTSFDEAYAKLHVQRFYQQMANTTLETVQRRRYDRTSNTFVDIPNEFYTFEKNTYYNYDELKNHINFDNACVYFIYAIVFGMIDSMCKNLTIRFWGDHVGYTTFYDMDSAFGLTNDGRDTVTYTAHLHDYYNVRNAGNITTDQGEDKNYPSTDSKLQYYTAYYGRIWEILENMGIIDPGHSGGYYSLEQVYIMMRQNLIPDAINFINSYYKDYTDKTGAIVFNYDYDIKYNQSKLTYDFNTGEYTDTKDFSQMRFLYGNRVIHVKDWFKKRIDYLDSIYGWSSSGAADGMPETAVISGNWIDNRLATSSYKMLDLGIKAISKVRSRISYDTAATYAYWIDENLNSISIPINLNGAPLQLVSNSHYITFNNFKEYNWINLPVIDLPNLIELDMSNLKNLMAENTFIGGVYNGIKGLKNIRKLNMSGVQLQGDGASTYTLDVTKCKKLEHLDISMSSITRVNLSSDAVLRYYDLGHTAITELDLSNQSLLEYVNIAGCNLLNKVTLSNCASLRTIDIPANVSTIIIRNCPLLENISIPYISSNNSISPLVSVSIDNCPGMKVFNIQGQNNPNLEIDLVGAWNLEDLNVGQTNYSRMNLPPLYVEGKPHFKSLKSLNISSTSISKLTYNDSSEDFLDLRAFPDLDNIMAYRCDHLQVVHCLNNEYNPISLNGYSFSGCSSLKRIYGHYELNGNEIFKDCQNLILNESSYYDKQGTDEFLKGSDVTNISFNTNNASIIGVFEGCTSITYNDFKYIMLKTVPSITSIEKMFSGCNNISGSLWYDMFRNLPNLQIMKEAFQGTLLTGIFYSRENNYLPTKDSTWGILDFIPKIEDVESAFASTNIEWIDNNVFAPIIYDNTITYSPIKKITGMFKGCSSLKACENTRDSVIQESTLKSSTFFIHLNNLLDTYPKNVFEDCGNIKMSIDEDENGNTLLFHVKSKPLSQITIDDSIYAGIKLVGEIKVNVFGGISDKTGDYFIPTFNTIKNPFGRSGGEILADISTFDNLFDSFRSTLKQSVGIFSGLKLKGTRKLPPNIFKGCVSLNSVQGMFSNLNLDYEGEEFEFPIKGMFDDCISLQNASNLLANTNSYKIKLVGSGFKNCNLTDVSNMFANSAIYGIIPYRLLFMVRNNSINSSISNMSGIFNGCYYLGYDKTRTFDIGSVLTANRVTTWDDHIVINPGERVFFKLDVSNLKKEYDYESKEETFDSWYLDGYGWKDASTSVENSEDLKKFKESLSYYLSYDLKQEEVINLDNIDIIYMNTYQNYMIPTDLFRYCSKDCSLSGILADLNWKTKVIQENLETGDRFIVDKDEYEGMKGRIPMKLLESLKDIKSVSGIFNNTKFEAFVGLYSKSNVYTRGIMYPPDLFKFNTSIEDASNAFSNTEIYVGVDINPDLFINNTELRNVSGLWSNCKFDKRNYNLSGGEEKNSQIYFNEIFKNCVRITNASGMFSVTNTLAPGLGLLLITNDLLRTCYLINDVSGMFSSCKDLKGAVPEFKESMYPYLKSVTGYLSRVEKDNITNANDLESRLIPTEWLN